MKQGKNQKVLFTIWLVLAVLSVFTIILSLFDVSLFIISSIFSLFFALAIISLFISLYSMRQLIIDFRKIQEEKVKKESCVRSVYMYEQLLDPPSMNN